MESLTLHEDLANVTVNSSLQPNKGVQHVELREKWSLAPSQIDRQNRVIYNVSVITKGPALGHGLWIDEVFLRQVVAFAEQMERGVPMRWTHPTFCDDGMGKQVARLKNLRLDDATSSVRGDVYFYKKTTGNRAELIEEIFNLAEEDPEVLGVSIVFDVDEEAMLKFIQEHRQGEAGFVSPDEANTENWPHVRLDQLYYADFVNEPAANPGGLFARKFDQAKLMNLLGREDLLRCLGYLISPGKFEDPTSDDLRRFFASTGISLEEARVFVSYFLNHFGLFVASSEDFVAWLNSPSKLQRKVFRAISYRSAHPNGTPLDDRDASWDASSEVSKATVDDLKVMCAWVEDGKEDNKTAYKFPHHRAGGEHKVVWRAVANAAARLPQANIPESDVPGVRAHIGRHYREFGEEPPWSRDPDAWEVYLARVEEDNPQSDDELAELLLDCGFAIEASFVSKQKILEKVQSIVDNRIKEFITKLTGRRV